MKINESKAGKTFVELERERERSHNILQQDRSFVSGRKVLSKFAEVLVLSVFFSGVIFWCTGGGYYVVKRINETEMSVGEWVNRKKFFPVGMQEWMQWMTA